MKSNGGPSGLNEYQRMKMITRRGRVAEMLLQGVTSKHKIAAALGVHQDTVSVDIRVVMEQWLRLEIKQARTKAAFRVKQLEELMHANYAAFERSKQDAEEVETEYHQRKCPDCKGSGFRDNGVDWCEPCGGKGVVFVEQVTKKVRGQAGDPKYLEQIRQCIIEAAKIEGLYPTGLKLVSKQTVNNIVSNGSQLSLDGVPDELVLEARQTLLRLAQASSNGNGNGNVKVIDVEPEKPK